MASLLPSLGRRKLPMLEMPRQGIVAKPLILEATQSLTIMSSTVTPTGHTCAVEPSSAAFGNAFQAFDGGPQPAGAQSSQTTFTRTFPQAYLFGGYAMTPRSGFPTQAPYTWFFEGSNADTTVWDVLHSMSGYLFPDSSRKVFTFSTTKTYSKLQLRCNGLRPDSDAGYIILTELEFLRMVPAS